MSKTYTLFEESNGSASTLLQLLVSASTTVLLLPMSAVATKHSFNNQTKVGKRIWNVTLIEVWRLYL